MRATSGFGDPRYPDLPLHMLLVGTMPAAASAAGTTTEVKLRSEDHAGAFPVEIAFDGHG
jgi:hypothetical protein